ncbi:hypothetical protein PTSG_01215 [Salpingoeca rosetta]|uniref:type I protein arginine methyltransferase n=1 Tax=Salpingoeca rosetta (strain ATCC 50818 / BSB-021) TaxID=946362 RepID=F2U153_SALR5|nr:uncharacterized protein PTSG_01215 [Salpingoeca rosetta]EGD80627.1 hypothetical protein PTSG_01215 [Salpingoeca rosetta]|eukprot:XP_004997188.1 hypothetical protein PTSG_01215 [Salpingoeca rosetta]
MAGREGGGGCAGCALRAAEVHVCVVCGQVHCGPREQVLVHMLGAHSLVINDVHKISNLPEYLSYYRKAYLQQEQQASTAPLAAMCSVLQRSEAETAKQQSTGTQPSATATTAAATAPSDDPIHASEDKLYMLGGSAADIRLRKLFNDKRLKQVLECKRLERSQPFSRRCFFCKDADPIDGVRPFLDHLFSRHHFNIGLPDNIVHIHQLLDKIEARVCERICPYCCKRFDDWPKFKAHLRKKRHYKLNPNDHTFDEHYIITYTDPGTPWQTIVDDDGDGGGTSDGAQSSDGGNSSSGGGSRRGSGRRKRQHKTQRGRGKSHQHATPSSSSSSPAARVPHQHHKQHQGHTDDDEVMQRERVGKSGQHSKQKRRQRHQHQHQHQHHDGSGGETESGAETGSHTDTCAPPRSEQRDEGAWRRTPATTSTLATTSTTATSTTATAPATDCAACTAAVGEPTQAGSIGDADAALASVAAARAPAQTSAPRGDTGAVTRKGMEMEGKGRGERGQRQRWGHGRERGAVNSSSWRGHGGSAHRRIQRRGGADDDDDNGGDDEGEWRTWLESEKAPTSCLFCSTVCMHPDHVLRHMRQVHGCDLLAVMAKHRLDFYSRVKLVNFLRSARPVLAPHELTRVLAERSFLADKYLQPEEPGDHLLTRLIGDDDDHK